MCHTGLVLCFSAVGWDNPSPALFRHEVPSLGVTVAPGCHCTHYVAQPGLELAAVLLSAGITACATTHLRSQFFTALSERLSQVGERPFSKAAFLRPCQFLLMTF